MRISRSCGARIVQSFFLGLLILTGILTGSNVGGVAQAPAAAPQPQASAVEDGASLPGSHRISIDVVVRDKQGNPVRGLNASDFTVLDNKAPQKLLSFRAIDAQTQHAPGASVLIVLDSINANFGTVARAREELSLFLKQNGGELADPTSVAVFADAGVRIQQDSTRDGNALDVAFNKQTIGLRSVGNSAGFWGATERLETSLNQLSQLAAYEATVPGRKLVLVIGPGWPLLPFAGDQADMKQRTWVFNSIVHLTNGLREAHIALYCLDPFDLGRTDPFYYQGFLKGVAAPKDAQYGNLALQVLADHSGGRVIINGRDISGELNDAVRDAGASYELTFEAARADRPDEYHALAVKVDQSNVTVHTSAGYYAHEQTLSAK
jgi:VWFA-related protein